MAVTQPVMVSTSPPSPSARALATPTGTLHPPLEDAQARAFGTAAPRRLAVRERLAQRARLGVVAADLDAERALGHGVEERGRGARRT